MNHVTLYVLHIVILYAVENERIRRAAFVIEEVNVMRSPSLTNEQPINVIVVIRRAAVLLLYSLSVRAVFVRCGNAALYYGSKLAPVLPRKGVRTAIVVRKGKKKLFFLPFRYFNYSILILRFSTKGRTV